MGLSEYPCECNRYLNGLCVGLSSAYPSNTRKYRGGPFQLLANRNVGAKSGLPDVYDWVDGGKVGEVEGFWQRGVNTFSPWFKQGDAISPEKQFLIDIEFDGKFVAREAFCSFLLTHRHWTSRAPLKVAVERSGLVSCFLDVFVRLEAGYYQRSCCF